MALTLLKPDEIITRLQQKTHAAQASYLAMYNSWLGGVVTDPALMFVPVDDHLVHRGDGVFEALKAVDGHIFLLDQHLERLRFSAEKISLPLPYTLEEIKSIILETARIVGRKDVLFRLYIARGPGGFTTNPYESVGSQMYLVLTELKSLAPEKYEKGISIGRSQIPPKEGWLAQVKTCNYLVNVLMKKESVDRKLDFTVGFDSQGYLTESSTENIIFIDQNNVLVRPYLRQILKGTTMMRSFDLAQELFQKKIVAGIAERDLQESEILQAKEIMMIGTTLDVLPVTRYEGKAVGSGEVGPVAKELLKLLRADMKKGPCVTPFEV